MLQTKQAYLKPLLQRQSEKLRRALAFFGDVSKLLDLLTARSHSGRPRVATPRGKTVKSVCSICFTDFYSAKPTKVLRFESPYTYKRDRTDRLAQDLLMDVSTASLAHSIARLTQITLQR